MKRLLLLGMCCLASFCCADEPATSPMQGTQPAQAIKHEIALKIDPLSKEQIDAGLTPEMLTQAITDELELASIYINPGQSFPMLVLHMRTAQVGLDMATFFQLCFEENAMLVRTRTMYYAITWSQNSILTCDPQNLKKEALATLSILVKSFIKDYNKAMSTAAS
jgi:hypothetical protein